MGKQWEELHNSQCSETVKYGNKPHKCNDRVRYLHFFICKNVISLLVLDVVAIIFILLVTLPDAPILIFAHLGFKFLHLHALLNQIVAFSSLNFVFIFTLKIISFYY